MKKLLTVLLLGACTSLASSANAGFSFQDHHGEYIDVLLDGKIVGRYMDAHDNSTKERRLETYKPYLHVFDAEGKQPITNGFEPKGAYPHHRGIFIGWMKIHYNGKTYDRWHMDTGKPVQGEIVVEKLENQKADADSATFTSVNDWNDEAGKPILTEERTMTFRRAAAPARLTIDFTSKLTATGDLTLDGDPEHAGVHFRPRNDIDPSKTSYVFPADDPKPHKDTDYPWVGETFTYKDGKTYSVVEMSSPTNPKGARWSAYRDYGRMGAFIKHEMKAGETLALKYRFLIADGEMPSAEAVEKSYNDFTGESNVAPKVTVMPAEKPAPAKPKAPAK